MKPLTATTSARFMRTKLLLFSAPGIIVSLIAIELALRVLGYTPYYLDRQAFVPSQRAEILYGLRPGYRGLYAGVPISVNSHGYRGNDLADQRDKSAFRIIVIGDSVAFGQGVGDQETLPEQLLRKMQRKHDSPVDIVNLGAPGYDTCQEYWHFREHGIALSPQVALLVYVENDVDAPVFQVEDDAVVSPDVRTGLFGEFMAGLRKHSTAYNFVWTQWQLLKQDLYAVETYQEIIAKKFDEANPRWQRSKKCLAEIISLARQQSIRIIIIPFPILAGLDQKPYPFSDYVNLVCDAALEAGAECLDTAPVLQATGTRLTVSNVETHPSASAYNRIAEQVVKILP